MIYVLDRKQYPKVAHRLKESKLKDKDGIEWHMSRVKNGINFRQMGRLTKKHRVLSFRSDVMGIMILRNTGSVFMQLLDESDDTTYDELKRLFINCRTTEIWATIKDLFEERLEKDPRLTPAEIMKTGKEIKQAKQAGAKGRRPNRKRPKGGPSLN